MKGKTNRTLNRVLIGFGSNIDPEQNLPEAYRFLEAEVSIRRASSIYESPAVGSSGPNYLNSAVLIETDLSLESLRNTILAPIEDLLNRIRSEDKYMDRTIDLDIMIFNQDIIDPDVLTQAHAAVPAAEILPDFTDPATGEKISQAAERLLPGINIQLRSDLSL